MFMFGLQESSKLNRTNFGVYLEDILISMLYGEQVDQPFLPCNYDPRYVERERYGIKQKIKSKTFLLSIIYS